MANCGKCYEGKEQDVLRAVSGDPNIVKEEGAKIRRMNLS